MKQPLLKKVLLLCLVGGIAMHCYAQPGTGKTTYNVKDFGATGDGKTIDTEPINKAIIAAAANGGGTVYFPAGTYASYSIHLKSHVGLYIDHGATILAAEYKSGEKCYDEPEPNDWSDKLHYQDFGQKNAEHLRRQTPIPARPGRNTLYQTRRHYLLRCR